MFYAGTNWVKIGDFGFSTIARTHETLNTFCGSPPNAAPELFKDEHYFGTFVDIWALGILLYFIVTGIMPFRADTVAKLKKCILDGSYTVPTFVSDMCVYLIRSVLKHIPQDRFTLAEIKRSGWLDGQEFPQCQTPYNLNPSMESETMTEDEREARSILTSLGIRDDHLKSSNIRDSRSSITGTYRIVLHRVQKRGYGVQEFVSEVGRENSRDPLVSVKKKRGRRNLHRTKASAGKPQSKTCSIL